MNKENIKTEITVKEQKVNIMRIDNKEYIGRKWIVILPIYSIFTYYTQK